MFNNQPWMEEFESLPSDEQAKVIDFIHVLKSRRSLNDLPVETPSLFDLVKDLAGIVKDGPSDLSSHPDHMKGYGSC